MMSMENAGNKKNFSVYHSGKTSIVVADDDSDIRKILNFVLTSNGFEVVEAVDGEDALTKLLERDVDIVISDIMMPNMDGLELCQRVKDNDTLKKAYFILLTAKGELTDKIMGLESGADEYISKPFEPLELVARVKAGERIIRLRNELEKETKHFEMLAFTDELTKLYNRRFFIEFLKKEYAGAKRYQHPLAIILVDIDYFKSFNDRYGHPIGDVVLQTVAGVLKETVRRSDIVARYGGEEFAILLPNTQKNSAVELAERLRETVENTKVRTDAGRLGVTISIGIGFLKKSASAINSPKEIFEEADTALLKAKQTGRNRVCY